MQFQTSSKTTIQISLAIFNQKRLCFSIGASLKMLLPYETKQLQNAYNSTVKNPAKRKADIIDIIAFWHF